MDTAKIQGELWSQAPKGWAEIMEPSHSPLWEAMLNASGVGSGTRFLDAGCGGGGASILAAKRGAEVSGLDAAEGLIAFARDRVPAGDFRVGGIENMPFGDNCFDVVFAANSVQYTGDRVAALHELSRVCAPEGRIVAALFGAPETVAFSAIFKALGATMPASSKKGGGPFELSAPGKFESLFEQAGLKIITSGEANCTFRFPDLATFWEGNVAAGPLQNMLRIAGEEKVKAAFDNAAKEFMLSDGSILIENNTFKYVVATV